MHGVLTTIHHVSCGCGQLQVLQSLQWSESHVPRNRGILARKDPSVVLPSALFERGRVHTVRTRCPRVSGSLGFRLPYLSDADGSEGCGVQSGDLQAV